MKQEHIHPGPHFEKSKSQLLFHARTDMLNQQRKHTVRYIFKQLIHSQIHSPQKKKKKRSREKHFTRDFIHCLLFKITG